METNIIVQNRKIENAIVVSQFVIPSKKRLGGALPFAFTQEGVAILSGILHSQSEVKK
jgi:hypothetical protein